MPLQSPDGNRLMISNHLRCHHRQHFALCRVDLAGHDRASRFILRQMQFAKAGARTGAQQADVVGDFGQRDRKRIERAGHLHQPVIRCQRLKLVACRFKRDAGHCRDFIGDGNVETFRRVEASADRGTALRKLLHVMNNRALDTRTAGDQLCHKCREFLTQGQWGSILQMGATDLDDVVPCCALFRKCIMQSAKRRQEVIPDCQGNCHVKCRGKAVVRRLPHVDMVVGMHRRFTATDAGKCLIRDASNDLVDVHIRLRAAAGLPDDKRELRVEFAS